MFPELLELLNTKPEDLLSLVSNHKLINRHTVDIIQIGSRAAMDGDGVAMGIFDTVGISMGQSAAGCIRRLSFEGLGTAVAPIDIVLVGSIWHKIAYGGMKAAFTKTVSELSQKHCRAIKLEAPAAVGGVLWAKEIMDHEPVPANYRKRLLDAISMDKYEALAR